MGNRIAPHWLAQGGCSCLDKKEFRNISGVGEKKLEELDSIIAEENLDKDETYKFLNNAFRDGFVQNTGTAISKVLPPVSRFSPTGERSKKRETVLQRLGAFFNKFWDISDGRFLKN